MFEVWRIDELHDHIQRHLELLELELRDFLWNQELEDIPLLISVAFVVTAVNSVLHQTGAVDSSERLWT